MTQSKKDTAITATPIDLKKGSYNRLWYILGAIAYSDDIINPARLRELTEFPRSSILDMLKKIMDDQVPELVIVRENSIYKLISWGNFLSRSKLLDYYKNNKP